MTPRRSDRQKVRLYEVRIAWTGARETVTLSSQLPQRGTLLTTETWPRHAARGVSYNVTYVRKPLANGWHEFRLQYQRKGNPQLEAFFDEIIWGESKIRISADWTRATAEYRVEGQKHFVPADPPMLVVQSEQREGKLETYVRAKRLQTQFKKLLLKRQANSEPHCELTGSCPRAVLQAAHVVGVEHKGPDTRANGLLLRADIHLLWDAGLFRIGPDGGVQLVKRKDLGDYCGLLKGKHLDDGALADTRENLKKRLALA